MNLEPEDPRLTAHALGELEADELAAVESAIAADPLLQAEIDGIREIQTFLTSGLSTPDEHLLPAQRERILRVARGRSGPSGVRSIASMRDALHPWLIPAAAAAVLAVTTFILLWMPGETKPIKTVGNPTVEPTTPPEISPPPTLIEPIIPDRSLISQTDPLTLGLPVLAEKSGLEILSKSILTDGRLPPEDAVKLGEILNNFQFRLSGMASISRSAAKKWHPDNRGDTGVSNHVATLSSELISCPWQPSARLLLISLRANPLTDSEVKITYHANPETVQSHRLLGFKAADGTAAGDLPSRLPAGSVVNLAMEIEPSKPGTDLGSLEWSTDGEDAPPISLVLNPDAEPSDDARFAALVCTWSEWLAGDQAGIIDADIVAALAREIASSTLPPDRTEFLNLIERSIHLENE